MPPGKQRKKDGLGRALIKASIREKQALQEKSIVHKSHVRKYNRPLDSVVEQTGMEDFMDRMKIADSREEETHSGTMRILTGRTSEGVLTDQERKQMLQLHKQYKNKLRIPRKPYWDKSFTKDQLHEAEEISITEWRVNLNKLDSMKELKLTPFEKNVEVWKQLWRVVERSDVIVQIVDGRNPLMFRCPDLEVYVKELDKSKINLLLVNKSDYLTESQRESWTTYFNSKNIYAVFFSALSDTSDLNPVAEETEPCETNENLDIETESSQNVEINENFNNSDSDTLSNLEEDQSSSLTNTYETANTEFLEEEDVDSDGYETYESDEDLEEEDSSQPILLDNQCEGDQNINQPSISYEKINTAEVLESNDLNLTTINKVYNREELLDLFSSLVKRDDNKQAIIGLVGYPNVGKSSTINSLMANKRVTVSSTPGKTKHFQTLYVRSDLILCDCPGLVFPNFVSSREEMVLWGILPIDRMLVQKQSPVSLLCRTVPKEALESAYSFALKENRDGEIEFDQFLATYALTRGMMTSRGRPDESRAGREVLKDFMNGRLLHCVAPPGTEQKIYHVHNTSKNKIVDLTPAQKVFLYNEEDDNLERLLFKQHSSDEEELTKGSKRRKKRVKMPKGLIEEVEKEDGSIDFKVTKPWKNQPKKSKSKKKNPNLNNPYADEIW